MTWRLIHDFLGNPCQRGMPNDRRGSWFRSRPRADRRCSIDLDLAHSIRNRVTSLLLRRGIDYKPVGEPGSWLWCLGGPDLYRRPLRTGYEDCADSDTCLDLNVSVCDAHKAITAELFPYDIVPESGGCSLEDPRQSVPIPLGDDATVAAADFIRRLEVWLDEILLLPE